MEARNFACELIPSGNLGDDCLHIILLDKLGGFGE
jgi:hypothetical protein